MKTAKEACEQILQNKIDMFINSVIDNNGYFKAEDYLYDIAWNDWFFEKSKIINTFEKEPMIAIKLKKLNYYIKYSVTYKKVTTENGWFFTKLGEKKKEYVIRTLIISACCEENHD